MIATAAPNAMGLPATRDAVFAKAVNHERDFVGRTTGDPRYFERERLRRRLGAGGTLPPARLASDNPIAIACLRLLTFLPERPLRNLPCFISCMARSTFSDAFLPYRLAIGITTYINISDKVTHDSCHVAGVSVSAARRN